MEKQKQMQCPKIAVTSGADEVLRAAFEKVNSGFLGGKISKLDLASWALTETLENLTEAKIDKIQKQFFNEICYLESVVKLTRQNGAEKLTSEQLATLQNLFGAKVEKAKSKAQKELELNVSV